MKKFRELTIEDVLVHEASDWEHLERGIKNHFNDVNITRFRARASEALDDKFFKKPIIQTINTEYKNNQGVSIPNLYWLFNSDNSDKACEAEAIGTAYAITLNNISVEGDSDSNYLKAGLKRFKALQKLDKLEYFKGEEQQEEYKKRINKLHSAVCENTNIVKKTYTIISTNSINEHLTMSLSNYFDSCHNLYDGCHSAGATTFINDEYTRVFSIYEADNSVSDNQVFYNQKIGRVLVHISDKGLAVNRIYPFGSNEAAAFREKLIEVISPLIYGEAVKASSVSLFDWDDDSNGYNDYDDNYRTYVIESYDSNNDCTSRYIGGVCLRLTGEYEYNSDCNKIEASFECYDCDRTRAASDMIEIDGDYYCTDCAYYCEHCEEYHRDYNETRYELDGDYMCADGVLDKTRY